MFFSQKYVYLGSPRTRRALAPDYLKVEGHDLCHETEQPFGASSSYLCLPASKPWCCDQKAWLALTFGPQGQGSGLSNCTAPPGVNQDTCEGMTNWEGKLCF